MPNNTTLLVTGAGAPGIGGTLLALRQVERPLRIIGVDHNPEAAGVELLDGFYAVPSPESADYRTKMLELCKKENVRVLIPQTTREIEVLSKDRIFYEEEGVVVMVSSHEAIHTANNKASLIALFKNLGFSFPKSALVQSVEELIDATHDLGYPNKPVAVKPPLSNGMRGYRTLTTAPMTVERYLKEKPAGVELSLSEFLKIFEGAPHFPELLVSEFLPGPEYSVDAFVGQHCSQALVRRRDQIRSGISFKTTPISNPLMERMTLQAGKNLGLHYVFGMQYKEDEQGEPKILECNPRIQGTMVATLTAGINLIGASLLEAMGEAPRSIPTPSFGASFHRHWGGIIHYQGKTHVI